MQSLTETLLEQGLASRILSERQIERAIGGSAGRRYGLVNRALKSQELIRIRRGLYVVPPKYRSAPPHPFAIAQAIEPGSYISFETALSFHGWIPEAVRVIASVVSGKKSHSFEHETFGSFSFHPLALRKEHFLELIERRQLDAQATWVAKPLRALMDLVTLRKLEWQGLPWLFEGLRIDLHALRKVPADQYRALSELYRHKRPQLFLRALAKELKRD